MWGNKMSGSSIVSRQALGYSFGITAWTDNRINNDYLESDPVLRAADQAKHLSEGYDLISQIVKVYANPDIPDQYKLDVSAGRWDLIARQILEIYLLPLGMILIKPLII
jgi:hypothetical protein